jgi:hypothetical protein
MPKYGDKNLENNIATNDVNFNLPILFSKPELSILVMKKVIIMKSTATNMSPLIISVM